MKVILLSDVYKHGVAGEIVTVADGFARNYLIPRNLAVKAGRGEIKRTEKLREQVAARRAAYENKLNDLAREIDGVELLFGRRAAVTGKLFGSVTTQEIADALMEKTGVDINRRRISQQSIREVGTHDVPVRLGTEISPILKITVVNLDDLAEMLASQDAASDVQDAVQEAAEEGKLDVAQLDEDMSVDEILQAVQALEEQYPDEDEIVIEVPVEEESEVEE